MTDSKGAARNRPTQGEFSTGQLAAPRHHLPPNLSAKLQFYLDQLFIPEKCNFTKLRFQEAGCVDDPDTLEPQE